MEDFYWYLLVCLLSLPFSLLTLVISIFILSTPDQFARFCVYTIGHLGHLIGKLRVSTTQNTTSWGVHRKPSKRCSFLLNIFES